MDLKLVENVALILQRLNGCIKGIMKKVQKVLRKLKTLLYLWGNSDKHSDVCLELFY